MMTSAALDMDSVRAAPTTICHMVAMPYPGRGHINSMMNFCKILASKQPDILVTFVVTEEWLGFIGSDPKPENIHFASIPNVVPSELVRAADLSKFIEAVITKMEAPIERLLNILEPLPTVIVADTWLFWAVGIGKRRNIPVAMYWPMSASMFTVIQHFHLFAQNGHFPVDISAKGDEQVDYIPGISSTRLVDLLASSNGSNLQITHRLLEAFSWLSKAQYLLLTSLYELESQAIDVLKSEFPFPVYAVAPAIPYLDVAENSPQASDDSDPNYFEWLDSQPRSSVVYISMGSLLSVSSAQMDELAAGLRGSGVGFLWVARGEACRLKEVCGDRGLVVPWCDQLRVLSHSSIGGFLTHCGWNSIQEGVFCGVPFLTFPIVADQIQNSKLIVEDWRIGWRVKEDVGVDCLVAREQIKGIVQKFMDLESGEVKEMRKRTSELQQICQRAIEKGGSSETNISAFIRDISQCHGR
ncbi:UDP-glycosyltransferase 87A1-like [Corylus avellana]|uniref:UDP-glycosyltransferase 87A1-like n=1 Tax=Corylus avellana TaxID=13451 RepID=UPI001E1FB750|nr:UDP-glycosyltransferase 87A1-like [Corylus avellana]